LNHKWLFLYPERAVDDAWGVIRRSFQKKKGQCTSDYIPINE
jgi:hypothetical protein